MQQRCVFEALKHMNVKVCLLFINLDVSLLLCMRSLILITVIFPLSLAKLEIFLCTQMCGFLNLNKNPQYANFMHSAMKSKVYFI